MVAKKDIDWENVGLGKRSDAEIAREVGCSDVLVCHYRKKAAIKPFKKKNIDWPSLELGTKPDSVFAEELGVGFSTVSKHRRRLKIKSYRETFAVDHFGVYPGNRVGECLTVDRVFLEGLKVFCDCTCDCGESVTLEARKLTGKQGQKSCGCLSRNYRKLPDGIAARNIVYRHYIWGATSRGHEFSITIEEFERLTKQRCYYCGANPGTTEISSFGTGDYLYNGIDRIDNAKGYFIENCVPCCHTCNTLKGTCTIEIAQKMVELHEERGLKDYSEDGKEKIGVDNSQNDD